MSVVKIQGNASGTGEFTIAAPNSNTNRTLTLPDATGTLNTSGAVNEVPAGSASAPSIYPTGDTNTGIFFPAADTIAFAEGGAEVARFDSSGNLGIGTSSPGYKLESAGTIAAKFANPDVSGMRIEATTGTNAAAMTFNNTGGSGYVGLDSSTGGRISGVAYSLNVFHAGAYPVVFGTNNIERARFDSSGNFLVKTTSIDVGDVGCELRQSGLGAFTTSADVCVEVNRLVNDGTLVNFRQDTTTEGSISVSGSTVSYNGGHLSRWAQMLTKPDLLKGTVMSNLDEMNVYTDAEGNPVDNEQLNKVKVSDVEGDVNVAGVFVNWDYDEQHQVDEINMAMTGDMIIRIAHGVVVQKGDLLMSAGDGTAKPQDDDIVRSKTVAKVTSNHVTCTYEDGSYCVPCVLMAC
jgi:hypothetical protein